MAQDIAKFRKRLVDAEKASGLSETAFAKQLGLGLTTYRAVKEGGAQGPALATILRMAEAKGGDFLSWLLTGKDIQERPNGLQKAGDPSHDLTAEDMGAYVKVNRYPIEVEAGNGAVPDTTDLTPVDQLTFRRDWLVGTRGLDPHKVGLVFIRGDSMYPTLWSGDLVMVDTNRTRIHGGGLYVIRLGEELMAKRLQRVGPEMVRVSSDNSEVYPAFEVAVSDMEVVGEIVWYCRDLK